MGPDPPQKKSRGRVVVWTTPYHLDMTDGQVIKAWGDFTKKMTTKEFGPSLKCAIWVVSLDVGDRVYKTDPL